MLLETLDLVVAQMELVVLFLVFSQHLLQLVTGMLFQDWEYPQFWEMQDLGLQVLWGTWLVGATLGGLSALVEGYRCLVLLLDLI